MGGGGGDDSGELQAGSLAVAETVSRVLWGPWRQGQERGWPWDHTALLVPAALGQVLSPCSCVLSMRIILPNPHGRALGSLPRPQA